MSKHGGNETREIKTQHGTKVVISSWDTIVGFTNGERNCGTVVIWFLVSFSRPTALRNSHDRLGETNHANG